MEKVSISAVIIAANAENTIGRCLASLRFVDEVVVYLNNSSDGTRAACEACDNANVIDGTFEGFGPTKNVAVAAARNDWVLSVDSDEWLGEDLQNAVAAADLDDDSVAFEVLRKNLFCGKHVRTGGWGNDRLVRLFNRRSGGFNNVPVHEKVVLPEGGRLRRLDGSLWHDAVVRVDQFLQKISYYSELASEGYSGRRVSHPAFALLRSGFAFFRSYVLQLGCVAGWRGLVIAYSRSCGTFYKYVKRYANSRDLQA